MLPHDQAVFLVSLSATDIYGSSMNSSNNLDTVVTWKKQGQSTTETRRLTAAHRSAEAEFTIRMPGVHRSLPGSYQLSTYIRGWNGFGISKCLLKQAIVKVGCSAGTREENSQCVTVATVSDSERKKWLIIASIATGLLALVCILMGWMARQYKEHVRAFLVSFLKHEFVIVLKVLARQ